MNRYSKSRAHLVHARPADIPRVCRWLALPAVRRGWGGVVANQKEVREELSLRKQSVYAYLIFADRRPIGFVVVNDSKEYVKEYLHEITPGGFDIDIFIALRNQRGRGIGTWAIHEARALAVCAAKLEHAAPAFYAWILESNTASRMAFTKAGYILYTGPDAQTKRPDTVFWLDGVAR